MVEKKSKKIAKKLVDAPPEMCFWVHNGPVLKNLKELLAALEKMKRDTFRHHVNKEKNDFSKWVKEVLQHERLAEALEKIKTKEGIIRKIKKETG